MTTDPRDEIRNPHCELCSLHEGAQHICLMGSGPIPSRIMLVGEAPGAREDNEHQAFVGASGKLLNKLLKEAGLKRKGCYVTNVAKCRPPENRTPTRTEAKLCVETYFWDEWDAVAPDYVLLLGNAALQGVLRKSGIRKHRGTEYMQGGATILPTYHPAYVLRNPAAEPEVRADFARFGRLVRGEPDSIHTNVKLVRSTSQLKALRRVLEKAEVIAFDVETYTADNGVRIGGKRVTSGLQEWRDELSMITCLGVSWEEGKAAIVPLWHEQSPWRDPYQVLRYLKPVLEDQSKKYIAHNGKFDVRWLAAHSVFVPLTFDTMLAAHILDENRPKGLKPLSQVLLGASAYDIGEDVKESYSVPITRLGLYCGKDCDYTYRLRKTFLPQLREEPRTARIFKLMMMPASEVLTKVERRGIWVDEERLEHQANHCMALTSKLHRMMLKHVPKHKHPPIDGSIAADEFLAGKRKKIEGINFNSPQQVAEWIFGDLGLPILEETNAGAPSTNESVMLQLAEQHVAPKVLLKYRKYTKYLNTYLHPLMYQHRDARSRVHPTFKLFGTVTGRLSCSDPNLQNIPRESSIRSVFGAPPGWKLITADYSQVELRIAAMLARETRMLRAFHDGRDIHLETAVSVLGKARDEITKEERKKAKAVNFGFLYGMGAHKFVVYARDNYGIHVSDEEAKDVRTRYFEQWPRLKPWHDRQRRLVHRYGRVQSPIGRRRNLPGVSAPDSSVRAEAERQAINSPVQSFASDLMLMSLLQLDKRLPPRRAFPIGTVHDELLFQVHEDYVEEAVDIIYSTMLNPPLKQWFDVELSVPIEVEISVGQHWGEGNVVTMA